MYYSRFLAHNNLSFGSSINLRWNAYANWREICFMCQIENKRQKRKKRKNRVCVVVSVEPRFIRHCQYFSIDVWTIKKMKEYQWMIFHGHECAKTFQKLFQIFKMIYIHFTAIEMKVLTTYQITLSLAQVEEFLCSYCV